MADWMSWVLGLLPHGGKLLKRLAYPLRIDVIEFRSYEIVNRPYDKIIILTAHPRGYSTQLRMTNRTEHEVIIRDVWVVIDGHLRLDSVAHHKIKIGARDFDETHIEFPVDDNDVLLQEGTYELHIRATRGREMVLRGSLAPGRD